MKCETENTPYPAHPYCGAVRSTRCYIVVSADRLALPVIGPLSVTQMQGLAPSQKRARNALGCLVTRVVLYSVIVFLLMSDGRDL
jgi:hypothetical protein